MAGRRAGAAFYAVGPRALKSSPNQVRRADDDTQGMRLPIDTTCLPEDDQ
jgi:hypothetical protein